MIEKHHMPLVVFGIIFLALTLLVNVFISFSIKGTDVPKESLHNVIIEAIQPESAVPKVQAVIQPVAPDNVLIAQDPDDFNIRKKDDGLSPQSPGQWDYFMKKILSGTAALDALDADPSLKKVKDSPQELDKRKKAIEDLMRVYEEKAAAGQMSAEELEEKRQELYMLNSMIYDKRGQVLN